MTEPILKLTGIIFKGDTPGVLIGTIKELRGITVQGETEDEVYRDLVEGTRQMLEYKHGEALALLRQQVNQEYAADTEIGFSLRREFVETPIEE